MLILSKGEETKETDAEFWKSVLETDEPMGIFAVVGAAAQQIQAPVQKKAKLKISKGGPGSGHKGHKGRPGKQGGSLPDNVASSLSLDDPNNPEFWMYYDENGEGFDLREGAKTNWVDSYKDVKESKYGKGYIIAGDDRIASISDEFGAGSNDHPGFIAMSADREAFGLTDLEARDFLAGYMDGDPDRMAIGWNKFFASGAIRVREFGDQIVIESETVGKNTLRRLQRLYDEGKFGITEGKTVTWEASSNYGVGVVTFGYSDFLDADVVDIRNGVLKEYKAKLKLRR